jgi:hypothetical protein
VSRKKCRTISSEQKKVSNQFQCAEKSVDPFPVCLSNYFMLVNFVEPFPVEYEFEPFPVKLSNHFSAPGREEKLRHVRDAVTNRSPLRLFGM